jgi:hypothetical protein
VCAPCPPPPSFPPSCSISGWADCGLNSSLLSWASSWRHEWTVIAHGRSTSQFALHALAALCAAFLPRDIGLPLFTFGAILAVTAVALCGRRPLGPRAKSGWCNFVGVPYVSAACAGVGAVLRHDPHWGLHAIIWIMLTVWAADSLAYFAGRIIGGPKLAPRHFAEEDLGRPWRRHRAGAALASGNLYAIVVCTFSLATRRSGSRCARRGGARAETCLEIRLQAVSLRREGFRPPDPRPRRH